MNRHDRRRLEVVRSEWAIAVVAAAAAVLVLWATRSSPVLSPDSITYLSTATNLRSGNGFIDFTGEAMAVFPPLYSLLLAPGGRALWWARLVGAAALAGCVVAMWALLRHRVGSWMAVAGGAAFALGALMLRLASSVWSEVPYLALAVTTLVLATRPRHTTRTAAVVGVVAGLGFLTRYAGVGLVATAVVGVGLASMSLGLPTAARRAATSLVTAVLISAPWIIRNLIVVGEPLGPRFEGGARESLSTTLERAFEAVGQALVGDGRAPETGRWWGIASMAAIAVFAVIAVVRVATRPADERWRRALVSDLTVGLFGLVSFLLPVWSRGVSANDIELRVMSAVFVATVYVVFVALSYVPWNPPAATLVGVFGLLWVGGGLAAARDFPDRADASIANRDEWSAALHDAVDELPDDAVLLSNSPQRVWWHNERQPVLFAFTRPRPGNSHYPIDADETLAAACTGTARLVWFAQLANAGDGPAERRPDLLEVVVLTPETLIANGIKGEIDRIDPIDPASCPP